MPTYRIQAPDGNSYQIEGPAGASDEQVRAEVLKQHPTAGAPAKASTGTTDEPSWADLPGNVIPSAIGVGKAVAQPFIHPIDTAKSLYHLGSGVAQKTGLQSGTENIPYAEAAGQFVKDRYGSGAALKKSLITDPVGVAADASMLLTGGGGLAARLPGMAGKVGEIAGTVGRAVDPLNAAVKGAKMIGSGAAEVIGGVGTHTGADALRTAAKAGYEGGEAAKAFQENMRGTAPMEETVQAARDALNTMRQERGQAYRSGMVNVANDKTILDFAKIDEAMGKATRIKTFKGQRLSPSTEAIRSTISDAINEWRRLDPQEFHTVEGMDALKQKIGDIRDGTQYGTPERVAADHAYQAIRKTIIEQAPEYAKVMKGYETASNQIKEIEKTLSLNPNASVDTSLRKLQSVLRDNVNTSFGRRKELAQYLVDAGAPNLIERLSGQALKPWTPRGLGKLLGGELLAAGAGMAGAGMTGAGVGMLAASPFMSPRLMGEAAYYGGKAAALPGKAIAATGAAAPYIRGAGKPLRITVNPAFQAGRISQQLDPREMVKNEAKAALRDKSGYTKSQIEFLRAVASGDAPVDTVMTVKRMLEGKSYQGVN